VDDAAEALEGGKGGAVAEGWGGWLPVLGVAGQRVEGDEQLLEPVEPQDELTVGVGDRDETDVEHERVLLGSVPPHLGRSDATGRSLRDRDRSEAEVEVEIALRPADTGPDEELPAPNCSPPALPC